jgi:hypothetical protein
MRRMMLFAAIFSAGFLARGFGTESAVQADGNGRGAAEPINGDVNGDGKLDVSDGIYIINYVFRGGPLPVMAHRAPLVRARGFPGHVEA